jgi:hypothetical protein
VLGAAALAFLIAGTLIDNSAVAIALIVLAAALLLSAVLMPAISRVEYGFPSVLKITADIRDRAEVLRRIFEEQRPEYEECAKLLCDDPTTANDLLTAALAQAAAGWRGPVRRDIRIYVLCWFVHRLMARSRLAWMPKQITAESGNPLSLLTQQQRILLVLNQSAEVPVDEIAAMIDLPPAEAAAELRKATTILADAASEGGSTR